MTEPAQDLAVEIFSFERLKACFKGKEGKLIAKVRASFRQNCQERPDGRFATELNAEAFTLQPNDVLTIKLVRVVAVGEHESVHPASLEYEVHLPAIAT